MALTRAVKSAHTTCTCHFPLTLRCEIGDAFAVDNSRGAPDKVCLCRETYVLLNASDGVVHTHLTPCRVGSEESRSPQQYVFAISEAENQERER